MSAEAPINRNDPCPCGSGKKYKKCCLGKSGGGALPPRAGAAGPAARAALAQAMQLHQAGRLEQASALYRRVIEANPREAAALYGLGQVRGQLGDFEEAIALVQQAIAVRGRRVEYHLSLAALLHLAGHSDEALETAERAIALDPKNAGGYALAAACLERARRYGEAEARARKALALDPAAVNAGLLLARCERRAGDLDAAVSRLKTIVGRAELTGVLRQEALNDLGFALDAARRYDEAYAAFKSCGEETSRDPLALRTDADRQLRRARSYRDGMTEELLRRFPPDPAASGGRTAAFLIGFSRSGTTMTEQVLAAHPGVVTSNEQPLIRNTRSELGRIVGDLESVPGMLARLDAAGVAHLRAYYWEQARRFTDEEIGDRVFVHKQPMNTIDIGLINVLFPDARVIFALRDPRDVCLSCFMQHFLINHSNVNFLSLERAVVFYEEVMDLWLHLRDRLTLDVIEVRYEDTVRDLEGQARRILDLLGVAWDDGVLRFQEKAKDRAIATPSFAAVTEPVHTRAVGRWQNYRTYFEPLLPRLQRFLEAFGYE